MKIVCATKDLLNGIQIVSKAVPANTTMPILECILIDATKDQIKLTANDTELGIETIIEGKIEEKGSIAIKAKDISEAVRKLTDDFITIVTDEKYNVRILYGKSHLDYYGRSGEDFTYLPNVEKKEEVIISQFTLKELIRQTIFSIGVNDNNKIMTGIHFLIDGDELKVTSLDGHRISIRKVKLKNSYEHKDVIIPGKTLGEISKILTGESESDISIYMENSYVLFEFDNTVVVSRLIDGNYFNVDKMISSEYDTKVSINKKALFECVDRSMLFSKEGNKKPIVVTVTDHALRLEVNSPLGGIDEEVDAEKTGSDIRIGLNPKFVSDALKVVDEENITLYFLNSKAPCYIKDEEENYIYMVLPVNLS